MKDLKYGFIKKNWYNLVQGLNKSIAIHESSQSNWGKLFRSY